MSNLKNKDDLSKGSVILYRNHMEVRLEKRTVWLTQKQMADLFDTDRSVITKHVNNVLKTHELETRSVCAKFAHTAKDGKTYRSIFYNLDMIISVGYRVNSKQGTQFRIWATDVLKKYLVDGYALNAKKLKTQKEKICNLQEAVRLLGNVALLDSVSDEAKGIIKIISEYSKALHLLDDFDHRRLLVPEGTKRSRYELTYEEAKKIIEQMRLKFKDSLLVGQEKDHSFKSSIGAICQTFGGHDLYPTVEEKAVHLLYFITKNHSFVDGNKRIAAALFVYFLERNGILWQKDGSKIIDDDALVALTLMIAASKPAEKDMMIKVALNILN